MEYIQNLGPIALVFPLLTTLLCFMLIMFLDMFGFLGFLHKNVNMIVNTFLTLTVLCIVAFACVLVFSDQEKIMTEANIRSEMEYRLKGETPDSKRRLQWIPDGRLILEYMKIRDEKRDMARLLEPYEGRTLAETAGSAAEKRARIEDALREKERKRFEKFLADATPAERTAYARRLEERKDRLTKFVAEMEIER